MLTSSKILNAISSRSSKDTATGSFIEWISLNTEAEELITPEHVTSFFQECLEYPHWVQNKIELGKEIRICLEETCVELDETFDFDEVLWPVDFQIVEIENPKSWSEVVHNYLKTQYRANEKFRIIHDGADTNPAQHKMLAIILKANGLLSVRQFKRKFFIRNGALTPLRDDLELHYNDELELAVDTYQKIEVGAYATARFKVADQLVFGVSIRGYLFQKHQEYSGISLDQSPRLFYSVKRLEQHFIKRDSDPFYQETILALEHEIKMLRLHDESAILAAPDLLSHAQNALEYVFIGDKLLGLLIRDLQNTMAGKTLPQATAVKQKEVQSWSHQNVSPKNATKNIQIVQKPTQTSQPQNHLIFRPRIESDLIN